MAITLHPPRSTDWRGPIAVLAAGLAGAALVAGSILVVQNITDDDPARIIEQAPVSGFSPELVRAQGVTASYPGTAGGPAVAIAPDLAPAEGVTASYPGAAGAPTGLPAGPAGNASVPFGVR